MDNQPDPTPPKPYPGHGSERIIQPTDPNLKPDPTPSPMASATVPVQASVASSIYPEATKGIGGNPYANDQPQVGVSGSQLGFGTETKSRPLLRLLAIRLGAFMVAALATIGFLLVKQTLTGLQTTTVQGDGFTYTITYSKTSSLSDVNGKQYLQGSDKSGHTMLLYVGKSVQSKADCYSSVGSTISVVGTPSIDGSQHNLCYSRSLNAYDMNFLHNGSWYFLTLFPQDKHQTLNQDTVKTVAASVHIQ